MNKERQQLYGIAKEIRNTNLSASETVSEILRRLQMVDVLRDDEYEHLQRLFNEKLRRLKEASK